MATKSIVEVEIRDGAFNKFTASFNRYQKLLAKSPEAWAKVTAATDGTKRSFDALVKNQIAATANAKLMEQAQRRADQITRTTADRWRSVASATRTVASNVKSITGNLLKWGSIGTAIGGLLGVGGLFGLDRLAANVAGGRRSSTGLDVGYGEQKAFRLNYGRLVDPDSFLSNVNETLRDVTRRPALYGAGLSEGQIAGKNTAQVAQLLLPAIRDLARRTPDALMAQTLQSRGLSSVIGLQDFQRLKQTSDAEFAQIQRQAGQDAGSFNLTGRTQKAWQDLDAQLSRAGEKIENVFVKGLTPLAPAIEKLSDSFAKAVETFLSNPKLKDWITGFASGIERAGQYIASDKFMEDAKAVADGIGWIADKLRSIGRGAVSVGRFGSKLFGGSYPGPTTYDPAANHNPGNLRYPGQTKGFASFSSDEEGIRAMARQLQIYQGKYHVDTIQGIVSRYAPKEDGNDVAAYVGNVTKRTGFGANQRLDLNDPDTLARVVSAMTKQENSKSNFSPGAVRVMIENNTGGNAIVTTSQVAQ